MKKNGVIKTILSVWLVFVLIAGSTGIVFFIDTPKAEAADSWYNTDWLYRKKITLNNTTANIGVTAETLTNFPILVKLDSGVEIDYTKTQDSGQDIRFTDSDGTTLLKYEIEKWDETGSSYVWVKVPSIDTTGNDYIYMYYGHSDVADGQDAANVWDSNYVVVQHLSETSGVTTYDSTSNNNDGTKVSATAPNPTTSGQIDGAQDFDGSDDNINLGSGSSLEIASNLTMEAWIKTTDTGNNRQIICKNPIGITYSYLLSLTALKPQVYLGGINNAGWHSSSNAIQSGEWSRITATYDGSRVKIYINNSLDNTISDLSGSINTNSTSTVWLGLRDDYPTNYQLNGDLDEVRISNVARSAAWVAASFKSETDAFNTFGTEKLFNQAPNTPTNSSPANASANQSLTPTLTSSAFSDNDAGDTHAASQWQITTTSGNYASTVFDSGTDTTNKTSIAVSPALTVNTTYYWHVKHKDSVGNWSSYSTETSFTTSQIPNTPTNSSPTNGALRQKITPTLTASAFSDNDAGSSHSASQWLIRNLSDPTYSSPVYDSGTDTTNKTSLTVPSSELSKNAVYYWKVRYKDEQNVWSSYSSETAFVTGVVPISVIAVGATEYTAGETAKLVVQVQDADGAPVNTATVTLNVYNPSGSKVVTAQAMTYITDSNGLYYYNYTIPATIGVYVYDTTASYSGQSGYSSHTFHVAQFAEDITSIKSTITTLSANMDILLGAFISASSTVNDAGATTTSFITNLTNATDNFYKNAVLTFTSGTLNGQTRRISAYSGSTKTITLSPALTSVPANGSAFTIVKQNVYVEEQAENIQSDVTYIKSKVDSIYTLLQTVDTNLSATQTTVNNLRTSQQKFYTANITDVSELAVGNSYKTKLTLLNYESSPVDSPETPSITIYDSTGATIVNAATMTKDSTGVYSYSYSVLATATTGLWEAKITATVGALPNQVLTDYFQVTGSPAQVTINSISDSTITSISANTTIKNEGTGQYEYHYEWCVVASSDNQCGGSDDVYHGTASKLINAGDSYTSDLTATVNTAGDYYFKVVVYYGTEASGASRTFTATSDGSTVSSVSSGGGGVSQVTTLDSLHVELADVRNNLTMQSQQLASLLDIIGIKKPGVQSLLDISGQQLTGLKEVQNKLNDLTAVSSSIRQVVESGSANPVVETYMNFNSVEIIFLITNPASEKQTVKFKSFLPEEVKPENIIDSSGLKIDFDANANSYYVSADIELGPKESIKKKVEIKDIWIFSEDEINGIKKQAEDFSSVLKKTQYDAQGAVLKSDILASLDIAMARQKESYSTPQDHIVAYRENKIIVAKANENLSKIKDLVVQSGASNGLFGKIGGIQVFATWGIILAILFGFGCLTAVMLSMWKNQALLAEKMLGKKTPIEQAENSQQIVIIKKEKTDKINIFIKFKKPLIWISVSIIIIGIITILTINFLPKLLSGEKIVIDSMNDQIINSGQHQSFEASPDPTPEISSTPVLEAKSEITAKKIKILKTSTGWLNVRKEDALDSEIIGKVNSGEEYEYIKERNKWYQIMLKDNKKGWVNGVYVEEIK